VGAGRAAAADEERRFRYPGADGCRIGKRLQGILFVLHTGIAWQHLPGELTLPWRARQGRPRGLPRPPPNREPLL